jgi:hypothetical protein
MTIKVSKPSINLREKLSELDFDKVPFQKMPAGSVLQVVSATDGTNLSTTAGSPVVGHTVSITPIASTSKILVLASLAAESLGSASDRGIGLRLYRDETVLVNYVYNHYMSIDTTQRIGAVSFHVYDYPATAGTLSYSYKYVNTGGTSSTARMNYYGDSIITLMEIAQ